MSADSTLTTGRRGLFDDSSRGVCFGFAPHTELHLDSLRAGSGDALRLLEHDEFPAPDGETPLMVWRPRPGNPYHARLFASGDSFKLWIEDLGWFAVDPGNSMISVPPTDDPVLREQRLWGIPAALCFTHRGDLPLHASAVEVDGRALLFVAPGRFGKTTLAGGFVAAGYRLLTEDLACVQLADGPRVVPGPPTLRLRPDVHPLLEIPGSTVIRHSSDRTHLLLDEQHRGTGDPVPLAGVVFLNLADGPTRLTRASASARLPSLWITSLNLPSDADRSRCFGQVVELAGHVKLWDLHRSLSIEGLPGLVERLVDTCLA